jgi:hypothetical protein
VNHGHCIASFRAGSPHRGRAGARATGCSDDAQTHRPVGHPLGLRPIVISQAAEFDYSGTQAVRALRAKRGYRVILFNSNPAAITPDAPT